MPFACGHPGLGQTCSECDTAKLMNTRADEIDEIISLQGMAYPAYVIFEDHEVSITCGNTVSTCLYAGQSQGFAVIQLVKGLREQANLILKEKKTP